MTPTRRSFFASLAALVVAPRVLKTIPTGWKNFSAAPSASAQLYIGERLSAPFIPTKYRYQIVQGVSEQTLEMDRLVRHYALGEWPCSLFNHPPCGAGLRA